MQIYNLQRHYVILQEYSTASHNRQNHAYDSYPPEYSQKATNNSYQVQLSLFKHIESLNFQSSQYLCTSLQSSGQSLFFDCDNSFDKALRNGKDDD